MLMGDILPHLKREIHMARGAVFKTVLDFDSVVRVP
jgi:hypothetical protein